MFQKFYNLEATGELNDETIRKMKQPRCGLPDLAATGKFSKFSLGKLFIMYSSYNNI